jgi:hypothetical protein
MHKSLLILAISLIQGAGWSAQPGSPALIQRGQYLVTIMGCNDCHTPLKMGAQGPEPDMTRMLSGHPAAMTLPPAPSLGPDNPWAWHGAATNTAFAGPWGVSYAANLTSDPETGLGHWTEQTFITALRTGKHAGKGRDLLPPMPWRGIGQATDADLKALFAFLQSTRPIVNAVPDPVAPAQP